MTDPFRRASISAELVAALGDRVDWGRPDAAGVYHPTAREDGRSLERLAIEAAARLEGEVSRLRTEVAACTEAYDRLVSAPLDVTRLARAIDAVRAANDQRAIWREDAGAIAAEYARLTPKADPHA